MRLGPDPVFWLLALAALALLFASAALAKLRDRARFAGVLEAYQVVPAAFVPAMAVLLPFIEGALAFSLFSARLRFGAALAVGALLLIYSAAIALNLARGRRDIDCGCEGFGRRTPIAPWMIVRNVLLAALALLVATEPQARPIGWMDAVTLAGGLAVFSFLYVATHQLLASRRPA